MPGTSRTNRFTLHPLAILSAAFVCGIIAENAYGAGLSELIAGVLAFSTLAIISRRNRLGSIFILLAFAALGSLCLNAETKSVGSDRLRALIDSGTIGSGEPIEIEGTLKTPPEPTVDGSIVTLDVEKFIFKERAQKSSGRVRIYMSFADRQAADEYQKLDLKYGARVSVACNLTREEQFQDPGVTSRIEILDRQYIDAIATLKSPLLIERSDDDPQFAPLGWIYGLRRDLIDQFNSRFTASTAGVLIASMLGDKYFLDKPTADVFREGGTFHVLVISGLHITFLGGLLIVAVNLFTRRSLTGFLVVTTLLWAYTVAVGADIPVIRASLMFTVLMFSQVIYRQRSLLNSLGACVIILLAWRPSDIFNPSFQLTVVSVAAIVVIAFPLIEKLRSIGSWMPTGSTPFPPNVPRWLGRSCEMLYWKPAVWRIELSRQVWTARIFKSPYLSGLAAKSAQKAIAYIFEGLLVSLIVQLCLLPFLIVYFHRITPVSIVMNLWIGVALAFESFTALAGVLLANFSEFFAAPFLSLTEFFNYLMVALPDRFVHNGWASWRVPHYSGTMRLIYGVYFMPILSLAYALWRWDPFEVSIYRSQINVFNRKLRLQTVSLAMSALVAVLALVVVFHPFSAPRPDGRLRIDFLDVGQGDSAFVTFPDGTTLLIDGGGQIDFRNSNDDATDVFIPDRPAIGETVVSAVLWEKGYSKIDHILATHADADHIQGLADVAENFKIGDALFGRMPTRDPEFNQLSAVLRSEGIATVFISRGQTMRFGGATVEVLYPKADTSFDQVSDNDQSVVVRIVYGNRAFLMTGDIERGAENDLVNGGGTLKADVIKVPHHGSRTSSTGEFIDAVKPEYAIISVGKHSRFGHPHRDVVDRWLAAGASVMTTGENGMISVSTDGKDLTISTYR